MRKYIKEHLWILYVVALILCLLIRLITGRLLYGLVVAAFIPFVVGTLSILLSWERKWPVVWGIIDATSTAVFALCLKAVILLHWG